VGAPRDLQFPGRRRRGERNGFAGEFEGAIVAAVPEVTAVQPHLEPLQEPAEGREAGAAADTVVRVVLEATHELKENEGIQLSLIIQVDTQCHRIPNFINKARWAGVYRVFIGLENVNPDNLLAAKKRQNKITEYRKMLQAWHTSGASTWAGYILGFPGDTRDSILRDMEIIKKELPLDILELFMLTPLPGSEDHQVDRCVALRHLLEQRHSEARVGRPHLRRTDESNVCVDSIEGVGAVCTGRRLVMSQEHVLESRLGPPQLEGSLTAHEHACSTHARAGLVSNMPGDALATLQCDVTNIDVLVARDADVVEDLDAGGARRSRAGERHRAALVR